MKEYNRRKRRAELNCIREKKSGAEQLCERKPSKRKLERIRCRGTRGREGKRREGSMTSHRDAVTALDIKTYTARSEFEWHPPPPSFPLIVGKVAQTEEKDRIE